MSRFPFSSLRLRLICLVLLIAVPAMGLTVYTDLKERDRARSRSLNDALNMARSFSMVHERLIENVRQTLFTLSQMPHLRQHDAAACSKLFAELSRQSESFTYLGAAKPDGTVFATSQLLAQPINFADRPWFQRVAKSRDLVIGEYAVIRISGKAIIPLAHPVLDEEGQLKAVLFIGLDLEWLNRIGMRSSLPKGTSLAVCDSEGTTLVWYPESEKFIGKTMPGTILEAISNKREGVIETAALDGRVRLVGFTMVGRWPDAIHVSVGIPRDIAFAEADSALSRNLTWMGLITVLCLLAALLVGEFSVMDPVNRLLRATQRLGQGELTARTGLSYGRGEISNLAHAFDKMAESLEEKAAELRRAEAK